MGALFRAKHCNRTNPTVGWTRLIEGSSLAMKKFSLTRRGLVQGAAATAAALTVPGFASADEPIRIGHQCDLTGALASTGYWRKKAADAAVKYVNEHGGIAGRQVELITVDTETKVDV